MKRMDKFFIIFMMLIGSIVTGCSREETVSIGMAAAKTYNESYKDGVIKNWVARVASSPACKQFKERFKIVGSRYGDAANGMFMQDVQKIWESTKAAGCAAPV